MYIIYYLITQHELFSHKKQKTIRTAYIYFIYYIVSIHFFHENYKLVYSGNN